MREKIWMRTVFSAYSTLDRVLKAIDKRVVNKSVSSSSTFGFDDTLTLMDDVLEQIYRKRKLCVLKYLTEQSVKNIKKEHAKILVFKFFDKMSENEIMQLTGLSERTIHRKIVDGLKECYLYFKMNGCDVDSLEKCFSNEKFLMGIYEQVSKKQKNSKHNKEKKSDFKIESLNSNSFFGGCYF